MRESALVNFRALEQDPSSGRHGELLRNVTALLELVSNGCDAALLDTYDSVMIRLTDLAEIGTRREVAARLAVLRRAPGGIVRTLALDEIEVAQPLLTRSVVLSDDDLIAIGEIRGERHRRAIAMRPGLSAEVSAMVIARGSDSVRRTLAGNVTALITRQGMERLIAQAVGDPHLQELLAERADLADWAREALAAFAGGATQAELDRGAEAKKARCVARAAAASEWTLRVEAMFGGYDFGRAESFLKANEASEPVTPASIGAYAAANQFAEAAVALARLAGVEVREVLGWFANRDLERVVSWMKAIGCGRDDLAAVLNVGPWRFFVTQDERNWAMDRFEAIDADAARTAAEKPAGARRVA